MSVYDHSLSAEALDVLISELLVATSDGHDAGIDRRVTEVLGELRRQLQMDIVFVSEFADGQRVFRFVEGDVDLGLHVGDAAPLEQSYCQRVVQGRLPELVHDAAAVARQLDLPDTGSLHVGAHLSTPVQLSDGRIYGTLCCFSRQALPQLRSADLSRLRGCARLVARKVEAADFRDTEIDWNLQPER